MTPSPTFELFGIPHITALAIVAGACIAVRPVVGHIADRSRTRLAAWTLAALLVAQETIKIPVYTGIYELPWINFLPLHLCNLGALLCAVMLVKRSYRIYEVVYFSSMGGSVAAMLTPDLQFEFPHMGFLIFFFSHMLNLIGVLFATFAYGFRPTLRSIGLTLVVTTLYAAVLLPLNMALGTNYLYLRAKPSMPTVFDLFGPWPWYIFGLAILMVVVCCLCYAPFAVVARMRDAQADRETT